MNLPRIAILSNHNIDFFFEQLDGRSTWSLTSFWTAFELQAQKKARNYPFLMQQGVWLIRITYEAGRRGAGGAEARHPDHGLYRPSGNPEGLTGCHHGESEEAQNLGLEIVGYMRQRMDQATKNGMNFSLIATPAEGLSGRFVRMDAKKFGKNPRRHRSGVLHQLLPYSVYYDISAWDKIKLEAPYHALTNGGHISYVELDGDPTENLDAFEQVVRCMKETVWATAPSTIRWTGTLSAAIPALSGIPALCAAGPSMTAMRILNGSAASPAIWWARWTASITLKGRGPGPGEAFPGHRQRRGWNRCNHRFVHKKRADVGNPCPSLFRNFGLISEKAQESTAVRVNCGLRASSKESIVDGPYPVRGVRAGLSPPLSRVPNPQTHDFDGGYETDTENILAAIQKIRC